MDLLHLCVKYDTFFIDLNSIRNMMATNSDKYSSVKMSGYLEKKSKMMMSSWKSHWFVLEGRLLLYYRSKVEYDALGPCKGSVSLGPSCSVKPLLGTACVFQIETRSNTIVLKARTRLEQEKWMQAILAALNQNPNATNGMLHFRYSSDDLLPRRTPEYKIPLSRQHTLPERLKVEKRHTFCRSFETLQPDTRPKSAIFPNRSENTPKKSSAKRRSSVTVENVEYCSQDAPTIIVENTEYAPCHISVDNTEYCPAPSPGEIVFDTMEQPNEEYYAISAPTEAEKEYLRKKSLERNEHIYERISGESRISTNSREIVLDNDAYSTAEELQKFCLKSAEDARQDSLTIDNDLYSGVIRDSEDDDVLMDNDQYCTPDIVVRDTELVSYHEYNIPEKERDRHIYSVPNFDNTDLNDNSISRRSHPDLNPYSVCQIYPKAHQRKSNDGEKDDYALYDDPDYVLVSEMQTERVSNVNKLLQKFKKLTHHAPGKEHRKKSNFLQKLFKKERKKPNTERKSCEDTEYAQVQEDAVKKMDIAYCIDKKLLSELEMILQAKKRKLEEYIEESNTMSSSSTEGSKTDVATKQQKATDAVGKPKIPSKPRKGKTPVKVNYENLQTIDEILNNLEQMKRNNTLSESKVKKLIDKFDHTVKIHSPTSKQAGETFSDIVHLRSRVETTTPKDQNTNSASNDELSRLLNELAKVTHAPILTPGVTSSLGVTTQILDDEFISLLPKKERRHSDPDYDIPRPHTNLGITKNEENAEETLTATRFFGPAIPNYEKCFNSSPPLTSMTPDSLEINMRSTNTTDFNMASYTSHKYATKKPSIQKRSLEDDIFVDSLEPGAGGSVI